MNKFKTEAVGEVGVNLIQGCNRALTSRQAGFVSGQTFKKMTFICADYERADRTALGHIQLILCICPAERIAAPYESKDETCWNSFWGSL